MHYFDPNYNPLLDSVETDYRKRVDQFTRDLTWGVMKGIWAPNLKQDVDYGREINLDANNVPQLSENLHSRPVTYYSPHYEYGTSKEFEQQFTQKWQLEIIPTIKDLHFWGYVDKDDDILTQKAIDLLHTPSTAPTVFISYRQIASSTLALAIEARLKYLGNNNTFIDKELSPGKRFDTQITDAIKNCSHFVLLVDDDIFAPGSGGVSWVKKEYDLAITEKKEIIPIIHNNALPKLKDFEKQGYDTSIQYIDCKGISAADYESAINRLLNTLEYATY